MPISNVSATSIHRFGCSTPREQDLPHLPGLEVLVAPQLREVEVVARRGVDRRQRRLAGGEVIGMADERVVVEAPLRVLGDDQVGPEAADLARDVPPQVERRGQVAVRVAEMDDLGDAQDVGRRALLGDARRGQLLRRHRRVLGALAAIGGDHVVDARRPRRSGARWSAAAPNSASSGWLMTTSARSSGLISSWRSRGLIGPCYRDRRAARLTAPGGRRILPHSMYERCRPTPTSATPTRRTSGDLVTRLRRIEGQARGIQRLVDEEAYCLDVLQQVEALTAAADQVALLLLEDHIDGCLTHAIETGQGQPYVDEVMTVVRRTMGRRGPRKRLRQRTRSVVEWECRRGEPRHSPARV